MIIVVSLILTACSEKLLEVEMPDGNIIEISTENLSKEQTEVMEQLATVGLMGVVQGTGNQGNRVGNTHGNQGGNILNQGDSGGY